jgi:hypothetical protein
MGTHGDNGMAASGTLAGFFFVTVFPGWSQYEIESIRWKQAVERDALPCPRGDVVQDEQFMLNRFEITVGSLVPT